MNREIKTNLYNILSHVCCAIDYGYYNDVLMCDFAELTGMVSDEEIVKYVNENKSAEYDREDYDEWSERITKWRDEYCKAN